MKGWRAELLGVGVAGLVPAWLFVGPVGPFRVPGLEGEGLYGQLFAGAVLRRWLGGEGIGTSVVTPEAWWPVAPLGALMQALLPVDPAWALGLVVTLGVWLAGYGPFRLARRWLPEAPAWGAALAGVMVQTSPVVLRAIPGVEVAALAVGPVALGLAHPALAWIAGLWSAPAALGFAALGLVERRPAWLVAGLPALALLAPASGLPGAMRESPAPSPTAPAYVTERGALFPLPPEEQAPIRETAARTGTGLWLPQGVEGQVRGNLFVGPPPTPGTGRRGEPGGFVPPGAGTGPSGGPGFERDAGDGARELPASPGAYGAGVPGDPGSGGFDGGAGTRGGAGGNPPSPGAHGAVGPGNASFQRGAGPSGGPGSDRDAGAGSGPLSASVSGGPSADPGAGSRPVGSEGTRSSGDLVPPGTAAAVPSQLVPAAAVEGTSARGVDGAGPRGEVPAGTGVHGAPGPGGGGEAGADPAGMAVGGGSPGAPGETSQRASGTPEAFAAPRVPPAPSAGSPGEATAGVNPGEVRPPVPQESEKPWFGVLLVPVQRLHGGPGVALGILALLVLGRERRTRIAASAGLGILIVLTVVFGWQAAPGETERDAAAAAELLGALSADTLARLPGGGALAWVAFLPAIGALGVAAFAGARLPVEVRAGVCGAVALLGIPLENPRLVAPVASVPPDPVRDALTHLEPGRLVAFPAPQAPFLQGQRPAAALAWEAAVAGQRVERQIADPASIGLLASLSALTGAPADQAAAELVWATHGDDPLERARTAGVRYLLVDLDALPALGRPRIDGWLVERAGTPVARDGSRLLYDLGAAPGD